MGPLTNPTSPSTCLIGVFSPQLGQLMIETLQLQGKKKVMVVCGREGLDEISPQGETDVFFFFFFFFFFFKKSFWKKIFFFRHGS